MDFSIKAFFGGDVSNLRQTTEEAKGIVASFAGTTTKLFEDVAKGILGAFAVQAVAEQIKELFGEVFEGALKLQNLSHELNVNVVSLQAFSALVRETGGTTEAATKTWEHARLSLDELQGGSDRARIAFEKLGLSAADFKGLTLDESLQKIAVAYAENSDKAGAYAAVLEILGRRNVPQVMNALRELAEEGFGVLNAKMVDSSRASDEWVTHILANSAKLAEETKAVGVSWLSKITADILGGLQLIANFGGATAATIANVFQGIQNDEQGVNNALLAGIDDQKTFAAAAKESAAAVKLTKEQATALTTELKEHTRLAIENNHARDGANTLEGQLNTLTKDEAFIVNEITQLKKNGVDSTKAEIDLAKNHIDQLNVIRQIYDSQHTSQQDEDARALLVAKSKHDLTEQEAQRNRDIVYFVETATDKMYLLSDQDRIRLNILDLQKEKLQNQHEITDVVKDTSGLIGKEDAKRLVTLDDQNSAIDAEIKRLLLILNLLKLPIPQATQETTKLITDQGEAWDHIINKVYTTQKEVIKLQGIIAGIGTSLQFGNNTTEAVQEQLNRDKAALAQANRDNPFSDLATDNEKARLTAEIFNLQKELNLRAQELDLYKTGGYQAALAAYPGSPSSFDAFLGIITRTNTATDKTATAVASINTLLQNTLKP